MLLWKNIGETVPKMQFPLCVYMLPLVYEKIDSEIRRRGCVIFLLVLSGVLYDTPGTPVFV